MKPELLKHALPPALRARGTPVLLGALLAACGGKDVRPENPPAASDCAPLRLERDVDLDGFRTDRFEWRDADCKPRSASLVRNDAPDPAGWTGGYVRRYTYDVAGTARVCDGSTDEVPGWGMVTSHLRAGATWGNWTEKIQGTWRTVFEGRHHALHEFRWPLTLDDHVVDVTVHYLFATGRSHPLYAITHDASGAPPDVIEADVRSPYGDILFDGDGNADISGVSWGDRYRFVTLGAGPMTRASGWDYREPNVVPYTRMWMTAPDAEMGVVQTQTWEQKPAGGYWHYASWGQADADGPLPVDWNWTYQLNQYQLPEQGPTRSHRLAWGSNFGAVGFREYPRYGDDAMLSGYPYQSYSVFMVLGTHSSDPVMRLVAEVEAWQGVRLTATEGRVVDRGPGGVGREDVVTREVPGYNPVYATWEAEVAANNRASLRFETGGRALVNPMLVLRGYTAATPPARVTLDGQALTADVDYFASVDEAGNALWLTLRRSLNGTAALHVE
ncbi:hypothetical protein [Myxococcus sp. Y35]|uniref:hypothetical protein n=1 Tax=Pseudomyxococcus flavus TaxID=3115648 RepID=UPI003CF37F6D